MANQYTDQTKRSSLEPLPPSNDEYWEGADTNLITLKERPKHDHFFNRIKGMDVVCSCGVGYMLAPGWDLKKGHIYQHGSLII